MKKQSLNILFSCSIYVFSLSLIISITLRLHHLCSTLTSTPLILFLSSLMFSFILSFANFELWFLIIVFDIHIVSTIILFRAFVSLWDISSLIFNAWSLFAFVIVVVHGALIFLQSRIFSIIIAKLSLLPKINSIQNLCSLIKSFDHTSWKSFINVLLNLSAEHYLCA